MELAKNIKKNTLNKFINTHPLGAPSAPCVALVVASAAAVVAFVAHGHWIPPAVFTCSKLSKRAQGVSHWQWHERHRERERAR